MYISKTMAFVKTIVMINREFRSFRLVHTLYNAITDEKFEL